MHSQQPFAPDPIQPHPTPQHPAVNPPPQSTRPHPTPPMSVVAVLVARSHTTMGDMWSSLQLANIWSVGLADTARTACVCV